MKHLSKGSALTRMSTNRYAICKILLLMLVCMTLVGCTAQQENTAPEPYVTIAPTPEQTTESAAESAAEPTVTPYMLIEMPHLTLQFPAELGDSLVHEQSVYGAATTEAFYMKVGDAEEVPLFRIDVGDENLGEWLGLLKTENGDIPVTYTVFTVSDEQLTALGEEASNTYGELMNGFSTLLEGIFSDSRFTTEKPLAVGEDREVQMTYWTVKLPGKVSCSETAENGNYQAIFFGDIQGESVALYTVRIGEIKAESELGLFSVEGTDKPVTIESYDLGERASWSDDDYSAAYRMMDTINHVIETIMSSEQFSVPTIEEQIPAPAESGE